jgi:SAM-dependent methyltransferase
MKFREHRLAHSLLDGLRGLEIGAASHNPFGLRTRNVAPRERYEHYAEAQKHKMGERPAAVDIWATAEAIPVPADSEDFVISSHVVEHLPNVVAAFREWDRIVRVGGYVFMIVPLPGALPADVGRSVTALEHIIEDYRRNATLETHPTEGVPGGRMGHYHVFTPPALLSVVRWMNDQGLTDWQLAGREDVDTKVGNGFTLVFRIASKPLNASAQEMVSGWQACDTARQSSSRKPAFGLGVCWRAGPLPLRFR